MEGVFLCQSKQKLLQMKNFESCNCVSLENSVKVLQLNNWVYPSLQCISGYVSTVKEGLSVS